MKNQQIHRPGTITESISGIVDRVTYHNPDNGWSVLRVLPFANPHQKETVTVHQTKVFAGATMEFHGAWTVHPKFGRQFKATKSVERKQPQPPHWKNTLVRDSSKVLVQRQQRKS